MEPLTALLLAFLLTAGASGAICYRFGRRDGIAQMRHMWDRQARSHMAARRRGHDDA
jgi:hypothetical protein